MAIALLCLGPWLYLIFAHGGFWQSTPELTASIPPACPAVDIVVPARDEALTIRVVIASLLAQDYPGQLRVILVDDNSTDGTAQLAGSAPNLQVITLDSKPAGWSGKLWALSQGVALGTASLILLTDADIVHEPQHVSALVAKLLTARVDLVSEMVHLNCVSFAERWLVPAFVYFFQLLYPFAKANDPASNVAAAAGGTVLIRREALARIGGIESIKDALIDDVSLARAVKAAGGIFLGHSTLAASVRQYPKLEDIWNMVARTAFTQLRYSAPLLVLTLLGLATVWWLPVAEAAFGHGWPRLTAIVACLLAALSYQPTLTRYARNPLWAVTLPIIALFFMTATVGSAVNHWRGAGARWKNRYYEK